jgi:hypothetical protein
LEDFESITYLKSTVSKKGREAMRPRVTFFIMAAGSFLLLLGAGCTDDGSSNGGEVDGAAPDSGIDGGLDASDVDGEVPVDGEVDGEVEGDGGATSCTTAEECEGDQDCLGNGCVDPVPDPGLYVSEAAGRPSSFFFRFQVPTLFSEPEACCFDYDGNAADGPDNALGDQIAMMGTVVGMTNAELQETFDLSVQEGENTLVVDWRVLPYVDTTLEDGDVRFSVFPAAHDPNEDWSVRVAGDGTFALEPDGFGTHGSFVQFNGGAIVSGTVYAGPSVFMIQMPQIGNGNIFGISGALLTLRDARMEANVVLHTNGVHTVDEIRGSGQDEYVVGGGRLGGAVLMTELVENMNANVSDCACAGVTGDVFSCTEDTSLGEMVCECIEGSWTDPIPICCDQYGQPSGCVEGTPGVDCCTDGGKCANIAMQCTYFGLMANHADVDTNANGISDALSVGFRFSWTGAAIDGLAQ